MGGFLYLANGEAARSCVDDSSLRSALEVFARNKLPLKYRIERDSFVLTLFDKKTPSTENALLLDNGDFAVATGSLIYRDIMGTRALRSLYDEHPWSVSVLSAMRGHFCLLLYKNGVLWMTTDHHGQYHVYGTGKSQVLSNSFLAVSRLLRTRTISEQELYEYLCQGAMYGGLTMIREIQMPDCRQVHQLNPVGPPTTKSIPQEEPYTTSCAELVRRTAGDLIGYFGVLKDLFGDRITIGLSGGFDSRLIVALLRKVGVRPYIYVNGRRDSPDVRVSQAIAQGEGFRVHQYDIGTITRDDRERFRDIVRDRYYFLDGRGVAGVLAGRGDLDARIRNSRAGRLMLNGGGGEIYRNFWFLPDRPIRIDQFLRSRYDSMDPAVFTERFDRKGYLAALKDKIKFVLQVRDDRLKRDQVEMIYPLLRLRYWMGQNTTSNNALAHAITPFAEPCFAVPSTRIPLKYKNAGRFEAELIRYIDPVLAKYPTAYGFDLEGPIPLRARMLSWMKICTPIMLRSSIRRYQLRFGGRLVSPVFLKEDFLSKVLDPNRLEISRYVHVDRIRDAEMFNRAMTAELIFHDCL